MANSVISGSSVQADAVAVEEASLALVELTLKALASSRELSVLQIRVLLNVHRHGSMNLSGVANLLDLSLPSASRIVTRLVEDGLLLRRTASDDRRRIQLVVSAKGRRVLNKLRTTRQAGISEVLAAMTARDREGLIRGLAAFAGVAALTPQPQDGGPA